MKLLLVLLAAAGLAGCVAYPAGYGTYYGGTAPAYGGSVYYGNTAPYVVEPAPVYIYGNGGHRRYGPSARRDRDGDGIPDRYDRDRDGDGVPNRQDARPNNPYRR